MMLHTTRGCARCSDAAEIGPRPALVVRLGRVVPVLIAFSVLGPLVGMPPAQAQTQDPNLMRRVERLQRELNDLQRYVYKGAGSSAAAGESSGDVVGTDVAARMQLQINKMQEQLRSMNGRVEEMQHRITVLEQRLDRMAEDLEIRLQQIEDAVSGGAAGGGTTGNLNAVAPGGDGQPETSSPAGTASAAGLPEGASPREQYDYAFELLKKREYRDAGVALESFLDKNPDDPLAANAIYWLGETHYVQKEYKAAAKVFLDGYQKYPTGSKAPDNLLKLGMSLAAYGDADNACKTFKKLLSTFPKAPVRITKAAKTEQKKLNCT